VNILNFVADSIYTKKLYSRLSSSEVGLQFCTKNGHFAFLSPLWRAMYDVHVTLIGKRVVDFLLESVEFFSLGVTAEALQANID